jgi:hypothetical protein
VIRRPRPRAPRRFLSAEKTAECTTVLQTVLVAFTGSIALLADTIRFRGRADRRAALARAARALSMIRPSTPQPCRRTVAWTTTTDDRKNA